MRMTTIKMIQTAALFLFSALFGGSVLADTLTWDGDTDYANGIGNANGNWNTASVWRPSSGSANVTWNNTTPDTAILGGTTATATTILTLDAATHVVSVTYANTSTRTFTIAGTDANTLTVDTGLFKTNGTGILEFTTAKVIGSGSAVVSSGSLRFGNIANTFSGGVTVNSNSTLQVNADSNPSTLGSTVLNGGIGTGTLTINGGTVDAKNANRRVANAMRINGDFSLNTSGTALTLNGPVDLGGGTRTISVSSTTKDAVFGASLTNGAIIKVGTGIMSLTGSDTSSAIVSNSFTQGVIVQEGTLEIDGVDSAQDMINALGNRDLTLYGGTTYKPGRYGNDYGMVLQHTESSLPVSLIQIYGTTFNGVISETGGSVDVSFVFNESNKPNYSDAKSKYVLSGTAANTYTGMTRMSNDSTTKDAPIYLVLDKTSGVDAIAGNVTIIGTAATKPSFLCYNSGKDDQIRDTSTVWVGAFGTYLLSDLAVAVGRNETIKALVANNVAGSVQFGTNSWGRLSLGTDQGSGSGLYVNAGGTLSGTGLVTVAATTLAVNAGGIVSPGSSGVGALTVLSSAAGASNVDFNEGSHLRWEVSDWTGAAGVGYDRLVVTGSVSIASTALNPLTVDVVGLSTTNLNRGIAKTFTLITASEGITGLTSDNAAVTVSDLPRVIAHNFRLRVENGAGNAQSLVLVFIPSDPTTIIVK